MGIAALLNLSHGGWEAMTTGAFTEHNLPLAEGLLDHIGEGDLLLADRAFCSYAYIAAVLAKGGHVAMRLHQQRDAALDWRKGRKISRHERLVIWRRPAFSAFKGKLTHEAWEALPATLEVRLIRLDFEDRTGRRRPLTVVTTLTDPALYDGIELHCLYARRWEIELRLRDIKPRKRRDQMRFLVETMSTRVIGHRPGMREPRAVKRRPKPYPLLNKPRQEFVEVPHRSRYRKSA